ncbi:damage-inducible protein DinB [Paenibacillus ferrarius]|uniref:Damage-inducible protein DinB n=1 Tax=Paenibacillus ferrarius TaxID=1469647 RepID=A0A1V4HE34_9BACL|nr:DinB family protein [Paenibacillus ferrarius]OPH51970.1 damage-inducible protein DinB [Paenibacillus ferrarius]
MSHIARTMCDFHVWANQTMLTHLQKLPKEVYTREIQSAFPTISKGISHIYLVDTCWLDIVAGKSMKEAMAIDPEWSQDIEMTNIEEMIVLYAELAERFKAFLDQQADLDTKLVVDNPYAGVRDTSMTEMILQIVNHATYHRGNITAMLRQMGHASVMTEYALYWYS